MRRLASYTQAFEHLGDRTVITLAAGATCAYLGDERNLREFLVADEVARTLRTEGHTVVNFLFDDSMDPLTFRQLRVAVNKDADLIEQFKDSCGKPISCIRDPWDCHESYAAHFENELLSRLHLLGCHPTLVSTGKLYARPQYQSYVRQVLEQAEEILEFLNLNFKGYHPEKLFWVLCPRCGRLDETRVERTENGVSHVYCHRCDCEMDIPLEAVRGKLNWKLDCAVRWAHFNIDAEPFNKAYLEPKTGTFVVAQALSQRFFGGHEVLPLEYGTVKIDRDLSYHLLEAMAPSVLRTLLLEHPWADITLTRELAVTVSSRCEVMPEVTYLNFVKQMLPLWLLTPDTLTPEQRNLVSYAISFRKWILDEEIRLHLPTGKHLDGEDLNVMSAVHLVIERVIQARRQDRRGAGRRLSDRQVSDRRQRDEHQESVRQHLDSLGALKKPVFHCIRKISGQEQGLPVSRFLFLLPLEYLEMVKYMVELWIRCHSLQGARHRELLVEEREPVRLEGEVSPKGVLSETQISDR